MKQKEAKKPSVIAKKPQSSPAESTDFAFGEKSYKLLYIGLALILLGFILMIGGGSDDPNVFSYKIFDFQEAYVSSNPDIIRICRRNFCYYEKTKE